MPKIANALQPVASTDPHDWRKVYDFWFPAGFDEKNLDFLRQQLLWWMSGGATPELPPFAPRSRSRKVRALRVGSPLHEGGCRS